MASSSRAGARPSLSAAEIETLLELEAAVAERAIAIPATSPEELRGEGRHLEGARGGVDNPDFESPAHRLLLSIEADIDRI